MTEADYILIDKKLDERLSPDEAAAFDQRCARDPAFAEEYRLQQQLIDTFRTHHPRRLKAEMKALHEEVKSERRVRTRRRGYAIAATMALLLAATVVFFYVRAPSPAALYTAYYRPYRATVVERGATPGQANRAEEVYQTGQYAAAIPLLKALSRSEEDSTIVDRWRLILGNAYLQSDSIPQALQQFERAADSPNGRYRRFARWYRALGHLKEQDIDTTQALLRPLAEQPGLFQREAQQLLDEL